MFKNVYKNDAMKREEHMAVRNTAGWYLWTHELVEEEGPDAAALLEYKQAKYPDTDPFADFVLEW